jgi:hypothetical protein
MKKGSLLLLIIVSLSAGGKSCYRAKINAGKNERQKDSVEAGIAARYPDDLNISKDKNVIFSSSFENNFEGWSSFCDVCDTVNGDSVSNQTKVLRIVATKHLNTGGDVIFRFPKGEDEVYLRFYAYFPASNVTPHHFVKIISYPVPYYGGQAGKKPGENKYFVLGIEPTKENEWHFYNYWQRMHSWQTYRGDPDSSRGPNAYYGNTFKAENQVPFKRDQWVCVETRVKLNDPGDSNGEMAIWINGIKKGEWKKGLPNGSWQGDRYLTSGPENVTPKPFEGFNFRTIDTLKINQLSLQWYISEERAMEGAADKNIVYFDDIVLARKYIGMKRERDKAN